MVRFHPLFLFHALAVIPVRPGAETVSGSTMLSLPCVFHDARIFTSYRLCRGFAPGHRARVEMPEGVLTAYPFP